MKTQFTCVLSMLLALTSACLAEDKPKPTDEQIQQWVKQLGDAEFEARQKAENALIGAGAAAIPIVTKAQTEGDAEVRVRTKRILEELNWAIRPDFTDLLKLFPADSMFLMHTPGLKAGIEKLRATAVGKLYDSPAAAEFWSALGELVAQATNMDDAAKKTALTWLDRYGGPNAMCVWKFDASKPWQEREQLGLVISVTDADPAKAFADYAERFPMGWGQQKIEQDRHRGVSISYPGGEWCHDAMARVKNLILRTSGPAAAKALVDRMHTPPATPINTAPEFLAGRDKVGAGGLAELYFSMATLLNGVPAGGRDRAAFTALGFDEWKYAFVGLYAKEGLVSERAFCKVEGKRKGLAKLLAFPQSNLKLAALCPADALAFIALPVNGKDIYDEVLQVAEAAGNPNEIAEVKKKLAEIETAIGAKIVDAVLPSLKGEAALWATKPTGPVPQPPDLAGVIETSDAGAATAAADVLSRLLPAAAESKDMLNSAEYKGRKLFWIKKEALPSQDIPYTLAWCADGARLLVASSDAGLQRLITRIDGKTPGLDTAPDFQRLLQLIPVGERGGVIYLNTAEAASWGYTLGMPALAAVSPDPVKARLAELPQDIKPLLKNLPGTLLSVFATPDGVQATSIGALPVSGMMFTAPFFVVRGMMMH
jgi:hypothetical protein